MRVELNTAWSWSCDSCGRDNFVHAIVPESLDGIIPEDMELGDFEGGEWVMKPETVECQHCGEKFEVEDDE